MPITHSCFSTDSTEPAPQARSPSPLPLAALRLICRYKPQRHSRLIAADRLRLAREFLILVLKLIEFPINSAQRQQFLMRAEFPEFSFMHHQYSVGALNSGQPVRNHY